MSYDIRAEIKGTAVYGGCKGIVYDERNSVRVRRLCELFNIKNCERGVGNSFTENRLSVGAESRVKLFLGAIGINEGEVNAHLLHSYRKEVICAAVDACAGYNVVSNVCDIKYCKE